MAANQNFRSAFNGFNREDVVRYIEYINAKHTEEINQLRSEIEFLQEKLNTPDPEMAQLLADAESARDEYKQQLEEAVSARDTLEARCAELEAEQDNAPANTSSGSRVQELEEQILTLRNDLAAAQEAKSAEAARTASVLPYRMEQELEAYRRAERTERVARERAEQIYRTTNGVLADAAIRVDDAAAKIGEMTDQVVLQLNMLQSAVTGSKQALRDAVTTMYAIRPSAEE